MTHVPSSLSLSELSLAAECLRAGGVVLCATDTVFGLLCNPWVEQAGQRVYAIKGRSPDKNLPVMVPGWFELERLGVDISDAARVVMSSAYYPGPLTVALGFSGRARPRWLDGRVEVAVRCPGVSPAADLVDHFGPVLSTSANVSGTPPASGLEETLESLAQPPDLVVGRPLARLTSSTIVNCRVDPPVVEREGVVSTREIERLLHDR